MCVFEFCGVQLDALGEFDREELEQLELLEAYQANLIEAAPEDDDVGTVDAVQDTETDALS